MIKQKYAHNRDGKVKDGKETKKLKEFKGENVQQKQKTKPY